MFSRDEILGGLPGAARQWRRLRHRGPHRSARGGQSRVAHDLRRRPRRRRSGAGVPRCDGRRPRSAGDAHHPGPRALRARGGSTSFPRARRLAPRSRSSWPRSTASPPIACRDCAPRSGWTPRGRRGPRPPGAGSFGPRGRALLRGSGWPGVGPRSPSVSSGSRRSGSPTPWPSPRRSRRGSWSCRSPSPASGRRRASSSSWCSASSTSSPSAPRRRRSPGTGACATARPTSGAWCRSCSGAPARSACRWRWRSSTPSCSWSYLLGFASVLWGATGIAEEVWVLLLFLANAWVLRREDARRDGRDRHRRRRRQHRAHPRRSPGSPSRTSIPRTWGTATCRSSTAAGLDPAILQLVFGVIIVSYFGHTSAANASKLLLGRDPSGRVPAVGQHRGARDGHRPVLPDRGRVRRRARRPEPLIETRGTAITPLAERSARSSTSSARSTSSWPSVSGRCTARSASTTRSSSTCRAPASGGTGPRSLCSTRSGPLLAGIAPTALAFLILEYLLFTDQDWFARTGRAVGVLTVPLLGGIFPMLLVLAARRRGEYVPGSVIGVIGHPVTVPRWCAPSSSAAIVLHALVIWTDPSRARGRAGGR